MLPKLFDRRFLAGIVVHALLQQVGMQPAAASPSPGFFCGGGGVSEDDSVDLDMPSTETETANVTEAEREESQYLWYFGASELTCYSNITGIGTLLVGRAGPSLENDISGIDCFVVDTANTMFGVVGNSAAECSGFVEAINWLVGHPGAFSCTPVTGQFGSVYNNSIHVPLAATSICAGLIAQVNDKVAGLVLATSAAGSSPTHPLTVLDIVLISLAVLIAVTVGVYSARRTWAVHQRSRDLEHQHSLQQRLLDDAHDNLEEATALNTRMRSAWQIDIADVKLEQAQLAEGGFGIVHRGQWAGHLVAVKVLKQKLDGNIDPGVRLDFDRECETLMSIRHTHLLIFFGAGITQDGKAFMVTEFMALGALKDLLADSDRAIGWDFRQRIAEQVAQGMRYLHNKEIVHRDLKSDNVLLNEELDAKVADFGTARLVTSARSRLRTVEAETGFGAGEAMPIALTATMTRGVGTPLWMAPELFEGGSSYGPEVDVYSYGVILWEILTRQVPWADQIKATAYFKFFTKLTDALEAGRRPRIDPAAAAEHPSYVALIERCWQTDASARPTFQHVLEFFTPVVAAGTEP